MYHDLGVCVDPVNGLQSTLAELKGSVKAFCEARNWDQYHGAKDLAIDIVTEGSELLEQLRFKSEEEIQNLLSASTSGAARATISVYDGKEILPASRWPDLLL